MTAQKRFLVRVEAVHVTAGRADYTFSFAYAISESNDNRVLSADDPQKFHLTTIFPMPWEQGRMYYLSLTDLGDHRPYEEP